MATHYQTAARSRSGERQNIVVVNSFEGKKGGRSTSNMGSNLYDVFVFTLFCEIHDIPCGKI